MIRRPPRSTRTDTLFPYTTLFRSDRMRTIRIPQPASFALLHWLRNSPEKDFPSSDPLAIAKASRPGNGPNQQDLPSGQPYHRCGMTRRTRMVEVSMRNLDDFPINDEPLHSKAARPSTQNKVVMTFVIRIHPLFDPATRLN